MSKKNTCLHCQKPEHSRGLCTAHYQQFTREKKRIPEETREQFDADAVNAGLVLPATEASVNPFKNLAESLGLVAAEDAEDDAKQAKNLEKLRSLRDKANTSRNDDKPARSVRPTTKNPGRSPKRD